MTTDIVLNSEEGLMLIETLDFPITLVEKDAVMTKDGRTYTVVGNGLNLQSNKIIIVVE
jgi:hypothetical protein